MKTIFNISMVSLCMAMLVSCEKPYVGTDADEVSTPANVIVNVTGFEQIPFNDAGYSRAPSAPDDVCTRLNFVIYQGDTKVQSIPQKVSDADFGHIAITLAAGTYKIAVIGHSSSASATITSLEKISFADNQVSDTFCYCGDLVVGGDTQTLNIELKRVVAMFRLVLTKELPAGIAQLKFYYTGGSSTLSALTGFGSVQSKQTVKIDVTPGQLQYEVFTIPHSVKDELKMTVTALDASGTLIKERVFEAVPVKQNFITRYTGDLFDGSSVDISESAMQVQVLSEWAGENEVTF